MPLLTGQSGLPIGVQLVGAPGRDARLLRTARADRDGFAAQEGASPPRHRLTSALRRAAAGGDGHTVRGPRAILPP
jgi:hypothetical protein